MRFTLELFGRPCVSLRLEHDDGIKELAHAIGELATLRRAEPEAEGEEEEDVDKPTQIQHTTDASMELDDPTQRFDPTSGWRWDREPDPAPGTPDARRRHQQRPFGFA